MQATDCSGQVEEAVLGGPLQDAQRASDRKAKAASLLDPVAVVHQEQVRTSIQRQCDCFTLALAQKRERWIGNAAPPWRDDLQPSGQMRQLNPDNLRRLGSPQFICNRLRNKNLSVQSWQHLHLGDQQKIV